MAEGGFDDMEMTDRNERQAYREYSDSRLQTEYDDLEKERDELTDDHNTDMPDNVRVKYDSVEDRLV